MKNKTIPNSAGHRGTGGKKIPQVQPALDYDRMHPSWRIGSFDVESEWGLKSLGSFVFRFEDELLDYVFRSNNNDLYNYLNSLNNKEFESSTAFFNKLNSEYKELISPELVSLIMNSVSNTALYKKIYPHLKNYESNTWEEVKRYTHGKNERHTNSHNIPVQKLKKGAQERLYAIRKDDVDEIFSLRLEGEDRIYGFLKEGVLDIIWYDPKHEIYDFS